MATDYTKAESDVLIDLIRRDNQGRPLTHAQVTFGVPGVIAPSPSIPRNTTIVASSIPNMGYRGNQTFYYNRAPLSEFVPPNNTSILEFDSSNATLVSQLLPILNERLAINITADKIVEQNLPSFGPGDQREYADVALIMKPNSLVYLDQLTLRILRPVPDNSLETAIYQPVLNGFEYA